MQVIFKSKLINMTPQEIRNLRLKNDYSQMVNIRGNIISWKAIRGTPPYVEEYELTVNVKGVIGEGPRYRETHNINVVIPSNYPNAAPDIHMTSKPFVYHPNWYTGGKWCFGTWFMSEGLGEHIVRMVRTIQYDLDISLTDRGTMQYEILIGRRFLRKNNILVDVSQYKKEHERFGE